MSFKYFFNLTPRLLIALLGLSGQICLGKDAFGLDDYKASVEQITAAKTPYKTKFGNPITIYSIPNAQLDTSTKQQARFLIQGGLHGNELLASEFVGWLAKRFAKGESILNTLAKGNITIDFIPYANPDGTIQYTRYNGNQINLNRNFDILWGVTRENPGPSPFSESESRAIRDLINKREYTAAVDVHGYINWIVLPTSPSANIKGLPESSLERRRTYERWAVAVKSETAKQLPGYEVKTAGELGDGGAFEDFAWWNAGVPAVCLELFTDTRSIVLSFAATIFNYLTPRALNPDNQPPVKYQDTFLAYENYIHGLFKEALLIKSGSDPRREVVSTHH